MEIDFTNLLIVAAAAFAAPLALGLVPSLRLPAVVLGAAFVAAGLVSVLVFPLTALSLLRAETAPQAVAASP